MISESQIKQYNEEGYTIVEDVFNMDDLNPILNEFQINMKIKMYLKG